jgi:hypothetical protein
MGLARSKVDWRQALYPVIPDERAPHGRGMHSLATLCSFVSLDARQCDPNPPSAF